MRSRPKGPDNSFVAVLAGYALGNLPSADIATHFSGTDERDLRTTGSGNPGALNAGKELGVSWGAAVFLTDVVKAWGAAALGRRIAGPTGANVAAAAAVAGHCYPVGRRTGGKGVAASIGQVLGTFPRYLPLDMAVAVATAAIPKWTQRTWVATAVASTVWVSTSTIAWRRGWLTGYGETATFALPMAALASSAIIARRFLDHPLSDGKPEEQ